MQREAQRKHLWKPPQNADHAADSGDSILGTRLALGCGPQDTGPPCRDATLAGSEAGPGGGGAGRVDPVPGASRRTKETAGRRPPEPISARQPLAIAVSDLQLPSPPLASPPRPARPPFCLLSPAVLDGPSPFPGAGYLAQIRAGGVGAGGCGGAAGSVGARLSPPLSPAPARPSPSPPPGPRAPPAGLCAASGAAWCARGRARGRRRQGGGWPGAAETPARHG